MATAIDQICQAPPIYINICMYVCLDIVMSVLQLIQSIRYFVYNWSNCFEQISVMDILF